MQFGNCPIDVCTIMSAALNAAIRERVRLHVAGGVREGVAAFPGESWHSPSTSAGRKCAWRFGVAPCALLLLPPGTPIVEHAATAIELGERLAAAAGSPPPRRPLLVATNPAAVDATNTLIRVTADLEDAKRHRYNVSSDDDLTVWIQGGQVVAAFHGEDAKAVPWSESPGSGPSELLAVYSTRLPPRRRRTIIRDVYGVLRYATGRQMVMAARRLRSAAAAATIAATAASGEDGSLPPQLANDTSASARGFRLEPPWRNLQWWEKNWSPLPPLASRSLPTPLAAGERLFSYRLTPDHLVIRCDVLGARTCALAHNSSSPAVWAAHRADWILNSSPPPRLTSATIDVDGALIGVGHYRTTHAVYFHFLYELEPAPPFAVVRASRPFRFRSLPLRRGAKGPLQRPDRSRGPQEVQFASGLYHAKAHGRLVITYGVGTRASLNTSISVAAARRMLADGAQAAAESAAHEAAAAHGARPPAAGIAIGRTGRERYRFCALKPKFRGPGVAGAACDDTPCAPFSSSTHARDRGAEVQAEDEPALALCPLVCDKYPFDCSGADEAS
jgi:hypothetical protein